MANNKPKVDWSEILVVADQRSKDTTTKQIAEEYGVHPITLAHKLSAYKIGKELHENNSDREIEGIARRENNHKKNLYKIANMRNELNKDLRRESIYEQFVEEYVIPKIKPLKIRRLQPTTETKDGVQTFGFGDFHYIDEERSKEDILSISQSVIDNYDGSEIVEIVLGGDFIENTHHRQQQIQKTTTVMNQIIEVSNLLAQSIKIIKENLSDVLLEVDIKTGNHDEMRQLNVKSREDKEESAAYLVRKIVSELVKEDNDITILEGDIDESIIRNMHWQHGHFVKKDLESHMLTRKEQDQEYFKGVTHFFQFHSHRGEHKIKKGTPFHFIKVPCVKTWVSDWEKDNNQIGTPGFVVVSNGKVTIHER